jgi:dipeptidyl aminopeptidase/acylaminoacyl peptidase
MVDINRTNVDIPIKDESLVLKGTIYSTTNTPQKAPWIINCPGLLNTRESSFVKFFSERFAQAGFYVLSYDYRAHGETAKQTGRNWLKMLPKIFSDLHEAIDWLIQRKSQTIKEDNITLFGRSLGGAIILTHGYTDERVKTIIACCTRYDYHSVSKIHFPEEVIKQISPVYFLKETPRNKHRILIAHCKDDRQIPFENLIKIKNHLDLPQENVLIFEEGGHSFRGHREEVFQKALTFLNLNMI